MRVTLAWLSLALFFTCLAFALWVVADAILWDRDLRGAGLLIGLTLGGIMFLCLALVLAFVGNKLTATNGGKLHSLWDGFLGRDSQLSDVANSVGELKQHAEWWKVDTKIDVPAWVQESHAACKEYVYSPEMLDAAKGEGKWERITLPETYLKASGEKARQRIVAAGLRLAGVLVDAQRPTPAPAQQTSARQ